MRFPGVFTQPVDYILVCLTVHTPIKENVVIVIGIFRVGTAEIAKVPLLGFLTMSTPILQPCAIVQIFTLLIKGIHDFLIGIALGKRNTAVYHPDRDKFDVCGFSQFQRNNQAALPVGMGIVLSNKVEIPLAIKNMAVFKSLIASDAVTMLDAEPENLDGMVCCTTADAKLYIPMGELVDVAKELERIAKELEKARKNLAMIEGKLSNENFTARAPEAVVNAEREKAAKARDLIAQLEESEAALKNI